MVAIFLLPYIIILLFIFLVFPELLLDSSFPLHNLCTHLLEYSFLC